MIRAGHSITLHNESRCVMKVDLPQFFYGTHINDGMKQMLVLHMETKNRCYLLELSLEATSTPTDKAAEKKSLDYAKL